MFSASSSASLPERMPANSINDFLPASLFITSVKLSRGFFLALSLSYASVFIEMVFVLMQHLCMYVYLILLITTHMPWPANIQMPSLRAGTLFSKDAALRKEL